MLLNRPSTLTVVQNEDDRRAVEQIGEPSNKGNNSKKGKGCPRSKPKAVPINSRDTEVFVVEKMTPGELGFVNVVWEDYEEGVDMKQPVEHMAYERPDWFIRRTDLREHLVASAEKYPDNKELVYRRNYIVGKYNRQRSCTRPFGSRVRGSRKAA
jgi:hypothetical protein